MAERAYCDTSVLVKRYVNERGSISARGLFPRFRVVSCVLAFPGSFDRSERVNRDDRSNLQHD
jgi:hypothetical protein